MLLPSLCMTVLCYFLFFVIHIYLIVWGYTLKEVFSVNSESFSLDIINYISIFFSIKVEKMKSMAMNLLKVPAKRCI